MKIYLMKNFKYYYFNLSNMNLKFIPEGKIINNLRFLIVQNFIIMEIQVFCKQIRLFCSIFMHYEVNNPLGYLYY